MCIFPDEHTFGLRFHAVPFSVILRLGSFCWGAGELTKREKLPVGTTTQNRLPAVAGFPPRKGQFLRQSALFFVSFCLTIFTSMTSAHAVSAGCQAARNGTFNLSAPANGDDNVNLNLAFEVGETLTFTTAGNPNFVQFQINGGAVPVTGSSSQFVFGADGVANVFLTISSQVLVPSTLTVTCTGTTADKQAAIKTLTDALRTADLNQQHTMMQRVQDSFIQGATVMLFRNQLEARLAQLRERLDVIERQRGFLSGVLGQRQRTIVDLIAERARINREIDWMRPLILSERGQLEREARAHTPTAYQTEIDRLTDEFPYEALAAERERLVEEQRPHKEFLERQQGRRVSPDVGASRLSKSLINIKRGLSRNYQRQIDEIDRKVAFNNALIAKFRAAIRNAANGETPLTESAQIRSRIADLGEQIAAHEAQASQRTSLIEKLNNADPLKLEENMSVAEVREVAKHAREGVELGASVTFKFAIKILKGLQAAEDQKIAPVRDALNLERQFEGRMTNAVNSYNAKVGESSAAVNALQGQLENAENTVASLNQQIASTEKRIASTHTGQNQYNSERQEIREEIARIEGQLGALQTRIGVPPTQFTGANLYGALGGRQTHNLQSGFASPLNLTGARYGMSFFTDLASLRRHAQAQLQLQLAGENTGKGALTQLGSADDLSPAFNIWAQGSYSAFDTDKANADRDGSSYTMAVGAYYAPSPRFMIGSMYRSRRSDSASVAQSSNVDVEGHGVGINSTIMLTPFLSLSGHALYEVSDTTSKNGTATGSFDTDQISLSGTLQGSIWRGPYWVRPAVGLVYSHADQDSYTDSVGAQVPGRISEQGQVTFGSTIGFRQWFETDKIQYIEPSFSATGAWTFKHEGDTRLASGTVIEQDDFAVQFNAGLNVQLRNNAQLSLNGGYAGLGDSGTETWSLSGKISIPLNGN